MTIAYIAHPISGNVEANLAHLREIIRNINLTMPDVVPFVPYYTDVVSLDDNVPAERERGMKNGAELLQRGFIDEVWLTGDRISNGMVYETALAQINGIPVVNKIGLF